MNPPPAASVPLVPRFHRRFLLGLLFLGPMVLMAGAEQRISPPGGDPVTELGRILEHWEDSDQTRAVKSAEVERVASEINNLGDLSRAVLLSFTVARPEDPRNAVVYRVRDRLIDQFLKKSRQILQAGSADQRRAAANLIAATARGARTRDSEPQLALGPPPGVDTTPRVPQYESKGPLGGAKKGPELSPAQAQAKEKFRSLRERLPELAAMLIRVTEESPSPRNQEVQAAAARALGELEADPNRVVPALAGLLRRGDDDARRSAAFALENLLEILLPQEQNLPGGSGQMLGVSLGTAALSLEASTARMQTMAQILALLPRALRDSDPDVRLFAARIYHRIAYAHFKGVPAPVLSPSSEIPLDEGDVRFHRDNLTYNRSLFKEAYSLQKAFNDQTRDMMAGTQDSSPEVRTEMCRALEDVARTLRRLGELDRSLQELDQSLKKLSPRTRNPETTDSDSKRFEEDRDRTGEPLEQPRPKGPDGVRVVPDRRPRDGGSRRSRPRSEGPGLSWHRASSPQLAVACEWGAPRLVSTQADFDRSDELLPPVPLSEAALACSAKLEAPVVVTPSSGQKTSPFRLVRQNRDDRQDKDDKEKPDVLPPPRVATEPVPEYTRPYVRAALGRLRDPSIRVRLAALNILEGMGQDAREALPDLISALSDCNRFVRWQTARIIGRLAPEAADQAVPALMRLLNEYEDSQTRLAACVALQWYAHFDRDHKTTPQVLPLLAHVLHHGDLAFRLQVMETIRTIGKPTAASALPSVAWALKIDKDASVRAAAARILGYFGELSRPALPTLRRAMKDDDPDVRRAASEAILAIEPEPQE